MRKAITAALEGDLIRGSRRRPRSGPRRGGRSDQLGGGFAMTHERRDTRANELPASLSPRMQALEPAWNLLRVAPRRPGLGSRGFPLDFQGKAWWAHQGSNLGPDD